jgi:hypothetical protein
MKLLALITSLSLLTLGFANPMFAAPRSEDQVTICHIPPGNPSNAHTITIGISAVDTHLHQHGDYVGECTVSADACNDCTYSHDDYLAADTSCISSCGILLK